MDPVQKGEGTPLQPKRRRLAHYRHRAQSIIQFQSLDQLEDEVTHGFYETTPTRQGSRKRVILIEVLNGLLWWICFGQLSRLLHSESTLSLWQQFSLIVLILICTLSFTCLDILRRVCLSHFGLLFLRVCSILILVSDWFYSSLMGGVIGGVACLLSLMSGLWNLSILDKYRKIHFHLLAFILLQIISFWFPVFSRSFFLSSYIGPSLGLIITCIAFTQDHRTPVVSNEKLMGRRDSRKSSLLCTNRSEWAWLGAGFGCHLFMAWAVFGLSGMTSEWEDLNSGTFSTQMIRILVIAAFCGGVLLGNESNLPLICSYQWLIMGGIGYLLFVYCNTSTAVLGLLLTSLHIMSLLSQLYSRLTEYNPSTVLPLAVIVYLCLLLISRVDVGGVKLSTYIVLVGVVFQWYGLRKWLPLGQELGIVKDNSLPVSNNVNKRRPSYTMMVGRVIRRLSTVQEIEEEMEEEEEEEEGENGGVAMNSIHRRRLLELLIEQEAEMRHFEVKRLRKVILCLIALAVLCSASV